MSQELQPIPLAFIENLKSQFSDAEIAELLNALAQPIRTSVFLNARKSSPSPLAFAEAVPWSAQGYYLANRPQFALDPAWHAGAYYVQEAAGMSIPALLTQLQIPKSGLKVLDLCAAPGGKTLQLANYFDSSSLIVANEVDGHRAQILLENVTKWGCSNVWVSRNKVEDFLSLGSYFDVILLDAPCSGEGMFRKDEFARRQWSDKLVDTCSQTQRHLLQHAVDLLKPNGLLVYSTCTLNQLENEEQLNPLIEDGVLKVLDLSFLNSFGVRPSSVGLRFLPHQTETEGLFLAALQKIDLDDLAAKRHKSKLQWTSEVPKWLLQPETFRYQLLIDGSVVAVAAEFADWEIVNNPNLFWLKKGVPLGKNIRNKWIPDPALALSVDLNPEAFPKLHCQIEDALNYLRLQTFNISLPQQGYHLLTYAHLPLGWINVVGSRFNNGYPKPWQLRLK